MTKAQPAIFLDRDGVLNLDSGYVHSWKNWRWLKNAPRALKILRKAGYRLVVVTNQSGIARGFYKRTDVIMLQRQINFELGKNGTHIDAFYTCPHHPDYTGACACRKPKPGLILKAAAELSLDLKSSWMIGDKASDIQAGLAAGVHTLLVETGEGHAEKYKISESIPVLPDLYACANYIRTRQTQY